MDVQLEQERNVILTSSSGLHYSALLYPFMYLNRFLHFLLCNDCDDLVLCETI